MDPDHGSSKEQASRADVQQRKGHFSCREETTGVLLYDVHLEQKHCADRMEYGAYNDNNNNHNNVASNIKHEIFPRAGKANLVEMDKGINGTDLKAEPGQGRVLSRAVQEIKVVQSF